MKGLERGTGKRLSEIFSEVLGGNAAIWVGPGHVEDFVASVPNCMVMAATDENLTREVVEIFKSPLIRFYYGADLIGVEIGAAAKNVVGSAAQNFLHGFKLRPVNNFAQPDFLNFVDRQMTVYGLSHLGDYEATLFSKHSRNRLFGEDFVQRKSFTKLAEGVETVAALLELSKKTGVELPISRAVYEILYEGGDPEEQLMYLFMRSTKSE